MKKIILAAASLLLLCVVPSSSIAHSFNRPHHFHHIQPRASIGFYYGPSWYYPPTFNYPPYSPSPYIVQQPAPPTVYIERNIPPIDPGAYTSRQDSYWYFCAPSNNYYPYVRECAEPWQKVPSVPPMPPQQ